ncbi:Peroxidasin homolog [Geodia barretti]|uniref:Peroxidasin homolog n=1 Tax=Geodia barretti TaxID=519541 RepID=A0AA35X2J5_GEOBA|nr:Peroxidasin homolog [Geodia barretti]
MRLSLLLFTAAVAVASVTAQYVTSEERQAIVQEAVTAAKTHATEAQDERKAKAQEAREGPEKVRPRHYKQNTKEARRQGEARQLFENMVHRAERKLAEAQRKSQAGAQSAEARAEELATDLFHRPGSLLTEEELAHMMIESECVGREDAEELNCFTPFNVRFRTADGTCNNLENPLLGAADTPLSRLIPPQYEDGISSLRGDIQNKLGNILRSSPFQPPNPSARHVSQTVIRNVSKDESLTHILMQFGQFLDHDLSLSPELEDECPERAAQCEFTEICRPIRVADLDPIFGKGTERNGACLSFSRSLAACPDPEEPLVNGGIRAREQVNVLTSFIDGSMIYGSDDELARRIRKNESGLLTEGIAQPGKKPELPRIAVGDNFREDGEPLIGCPNPGTTGCFLAGEFRVNEQVVLSVMHTLWFREHNRIARELARINPHWAQDDERLYQEARRIVGAIIQKITYLDYLPKILGQTVFDIVIGEYLGYDPRINPGVNNAFATAAYRYGHTLIRPFFDRLGSNYQNIAAGPLSLLNAFYDPDQFRLSFGTDPLLRGLVTQNARRVDEFLSSALTNSLFREQIDLASLNIQRGRDHGLPPYIAWQRYCQTVFPNLGFATFENTLTLVRFLEIYGSSDTIDLWIGGLSEDRLPGSLLGPTFACLFGITFANIRDGDRLYYSRPGVFKPDQLASIQQHTFASVICDNGDDITTIQRDVFLAGRHRVSCAQIPRINLELWREEMCYFRVRVLPLNIPVGLENFFRSELSSFSFVNMSVPASPLVQFECIAVQCPKVGQSEEIVFFPFASEAQLELTPNSMLPTNIFESPFFYASLPQPLFGQAGSGIFTSLSACQGGSDSAFSVGLGASAQQQTNGGSLIPTVPDRLRDLLFGVGSPAAQATPTESDGESDAQLMSDLEDALKSLQG